MERVGAGSLVVCAMFCSGCASGALPEEEEPPPPPPVEDVRLPDLSVLADRARADLAVRQETFAEDSCELHPDEMCIDAPGTRTLLHFSVETPNLGEGDLVLGTPSPDSENFTYSACHKHYHYNGYAKYELIDGDGETVRTGRKQAFCLVDTRRIDDDARSLARYHCAFQGIQRGWSDVYSSDIACQYLDVTDIPDGEYTLRVSVNTARTLPELDYDNNVMTVPVTLGDPNLDTLTETCAVDLEAAAVESANRECGWQLLGTFDCTPGEGFRAGCASQCGVGSCTGDAMLRVCDSELPNDRCAFADALGWGDNDCASFCPVSDPFKCPASGKLDIYGAASEPGGAFTCSVEIKSAALPPGLP